MKGVNIAYVGQILQYWTIDIKMMLYWPKHPKHQPFFMPLVNIPLQKIKKPLSYEFNVLGIIILLSSSVARLKEAFLFFLFPIKQPGREAFMQSFKQELFPWKASAFPPLHSAIVFRSFTLWFSRKKLWPLTLFFKGIKYFFANDNLPKLSSLWKVVLFYTHTDFSLLRLF